MCSMPIVAPVAGRRSGVAESARNTSRGNTESQQATNEMARMSTDLTALVANFRY